MRLEFYIRQMDPWCEQCIEYSSKIKEIYGFDIKYELKCRSVDYCKQCSLVWSCVEERGCLEKGIRLGLKVKGRKADLIGHGRRRLRKTV